MPLKIKNSENRLFELLDPIPGQNKSGESLRYREVYDEIREARREEDARLSQGVWKTPPKKADWKQVDSLCQDALRSQSKDLQLAIWLTEARFRLKGMEGLEEGLGFILELTHLYWDSLHPQLEGNGYELRMGLYNWLDSRLGEEICQTPITLPSEKNPQPYTFWDLNRINLLSGEEEDLSSSDGQEKLRKVSETVEQTPPSHYQRLNESCTFVLEILTKLEKELGMHLGQKAPTFPHLREKVISVQHFIQNLFDAQSPQKEVRKMEAVSKSPKSIPESKPIKSTTFENREQAYAVLEKIANYLERIEPHSPTPYLIRRAIAWGGMNLSQVVSTVLKEEGDLTFLLDILNVKKVPPAEG